MRFVVLALLVLGCTTKEVAAPPSPGDIRAGLIRRDVAFAFDTLPLLRFEPPFIYGAIRLQAERCSGLTREGWPRFYVAATNPHFLLAPHIPSKRHRGEPYADYQQRVHPDSVFLDKCGSLLSNPGR